MSFCVAHESYLLKHIHVIQTHFQLSKSNMCFIFECTVFMSPITIEGDLSAVKDLPKANPLSVNHHSTHDRTLQPLSSPLLSVNGLSFSAWSSETAACWLTGGSCKITNYCSLDCTSCFLLEHWALMCEGVWDFKRGCYQIQVSPSVCVLFVCQYVCICTNSCPLKHTHICILQAALSWKLF